MAELSGPVQVKEIPPIITHEGAACGPLDLKEFIKSPNLDSGMVRFFGELAESAGALPGGLICTADGLLGGIPAKGTAGQYQFVIIAENKAEESLIVPVDFTIKERLASEDPSFLNEFKSKVWEALSQDLPIPELNDVFARPISPVEIYYLLQRFAVLTIWDVYNLEPASSKTLLSLPELNKHYAIYDRGSCLVAAPKDLYSYERTLADSLQAAKVMAQEVYKRGWTIEFAGFNKMIRAAWTELQLLGDKNKKYLEILHYTPSTDDMKAYQVQSEAKGPAI